MVDEKGEIIDTVKTASGKFVPVLNTINQIKVIRPSEESDSKTIDPQTKTQLKNATSAYQKPNLPQTMDTYVDKKA